MMIVVVTLLLSVIPALRFHSTSDDHPVFAIPPGALSENGAPLTVSVLSVNGQHSIRRRFIQKTVVKKEVPLFGNDTVHGDIQHIRQTHHMYETSYGAAPPGVG